MTDVSNDDENSTPEPDQKPEADETVPQLAIATTAPDDSQAADTLFRLITDIHLAFARLFNHAVVDQGLTRSHWLVIAGLVRNEGLTQTELASAIAMARSPLGKVIDRLEKSDLIIRRPDATDRRVNRLYLTPAARHLVDPATTVIADLERHAVADLSSDAIELLLTHLTTVRAALESHEHTNEHPIQVR